jgi:hypothetical protein
VPRNPCSFGKPLSEQVVLGPKAGTFYSVDALNPDVVRHSEHRYLLFFSGNSAHTDAGDWRTGVAVGTRPEGPYRVDRRVRERFFNGGTALVNGRFLHGANVPERTEPLLYSSSDGRRWRPRSLMPQPTEFSWRLWQSDLFLRPRRGGLDVYFAGRPGPEGADLGVARYHRGRWSGFRRILAKLGEEGQEVDLGEPAVFRARNRNYLLYVVQPANGVGRHIQLAFFSGGEWRRCPGAPFIGRAGPVYPQNAIDPEPMVVGKRLYVFFGAGQRPSQGGNMQGSIVLRTYPLH